MKKILFRKILFDNLIFFSISLLSVSIIIWVFQAVNFLDIMIEDGRDYLVYFSYSFLNLPKKFVKLKKKKNKKKKTKTTYWMEQN